MEDWTDEQLLAETPATPAAFAVFYRRHEGAVLGYFMRRSGDAELAADLTAETFAAALLGARRYRSDRGEGLAWLYGIARHRLMRSIEQGQVEDRARRKLALPRLEIDDDTGRADRGASAPRRARSSCSSSFRPTRPTRFAPGCSSSVPTRTSPLRCGSRRRSCASASAAGS